MKLSTLVLLAAGIAAAPALHAQQAVRVDSAAHRGRTPSTLHRATPPPRPAAAPRPASTVRTRPGVAAARTIRAQAPARAPKSGAAGCAGSVPGAALSTGPTLLPPRTTADSARGGSDASRLARITGGAPAKVAEGAMCRVAPAGPR
ncbi:MAG: hypothetical protein JWM27_2322 [Gemmatimonadetes bacterium]|nr:hypothetical protein [Gemmatimonadota bacterium]